MPFIKKSLSLSSRKFHELIDSFAPIQTLSVDQFKDFYTSKKMFVNRRVCVRSPISLCRGFMELGAPVKKNTSNPFVDSAVQLLQNINTPAVHTVLAFFYDSFQPSSAEKLLGLESESVLLKTLSPWSVQLPWHGESGEQCAENRRLNMKNQAKQHGFSLDYTDGYNSFGPVSIRKLELEVERLRSIILSVKESSYSENDVINLPTARFLFSESGKCALNILEGNHRACVLAAMGYEEMSFLVNVQDVVHEIEIDSWNGVMDRVYSRNDALSVFNRFIVGQMPFLRG